MHEAAQGRILTVFSSFPTVCRFRWLNFRGRSLSLSEPPLACAPRVTVAFVLQSLPRSPPFTTHPSSHPVAPLQEAVRWCCHVLADCRLSVTVNLAVTHWVSHSVPWALADWWVWVLEQSPVSFVTTVWHSAYCKGLLGKIFFIWIKVFSYLYFCAWCSFCLEHFIIFILHFALLTFIRLLIFSL